MSLFGTWLAETRELQVQSYGKDPARLDLLEWLDYLRDQTLAAFVELGEYIQNFKWKPWAKEPQFPNSDARDDAIEEMVDVLHFIANNLVAMGVTDEELTAMYEYKMQVNRDRMAAGGH